MHISPFTPIYSNFSHAQEKCAFFRDFDSIFNWGQKGYKIKPYDGNSTPELIEVKGSRPSFFDIIGRIIAYITVIIPLIMLVGTLIYRAVNNFQISYEDILKYGDIAKLITSQLSVKELLNLRRTSHDKKAMVESELIERLNLKKITPIDCGFKTVTEMIQFFGDSCPKIKILNLKSYKNLKSYEKVNDQDIENIAKNFPALDQLALRNQVVASHAQITDKSSSFFKTMQSLKSLTLYSCKKIDDFSFLQHLVHLTNLNLSECWQIKDISFLECLPHLITLDLSGCYQINLSSLEQCPHLISLKLNDWGEIEDFSFLSYLPKLTSLYFFRCPQIRNLNFLERCPQLTKLDLGFCSKINDFNSLKHCPDLISLSLFNCTQIQDFSFLQICPKLTELNLDWCKQINDLSILQFCPNLTSLSFNLCKVNDLSLLRYLPNLTNLNLGGCTWFNDFSFLQYCPKLTSIDLEYCEQINDEQIKLLCDQGINVKR